MEALAVERDDAGGLLAAMLQGVQAERGDRGGVRMAEDAEHAAFLAQPVAVEVDIGGSGGNFEIETAIARRVVHRLVSWCDRTPVTGWWWTCL